MDIINNTSGLAFAGNPIILRCDANPSYDSGHADLSIVYGADRRCIFSGTLDSSVDMEIDVSEIVESYSEFFPEAETCAIGDPLIMIEDRPRLLSRTALFSISHDWDEENEAIIIPGGISRQNLRRCVGLGEDIFDIRFTNPDGNFFLTTRTGSWLITIKENELSPLYFINMGVNTSIRIVERCSNQEWSRGGIPTGVYALDIKALRRTMFDEFNVIANVFDVYKDNSYSCRIVIEHCESSSESYLVKFRNSLGVFDIIDLIGTARTSLASESSGGESDTFMSFDSDIWDFSRARFKPKLSKSISIESLVRRQTDLPLFFDMLASQDVFLRIANRWVKAIPSCEEFAHSTVIKAPESITVKFDCADSDNFISDDFDNYGDSGRPRVFSNQFSKTFN